VQHIPSPIFSILIMHLGTMPIPDMPDIMDDIMPDISVPVGIEPIPIGMPPIPIPPIGIRPIMPGIIIPMRSVVDVIVCSFFCQWFVVFRAFYPGVATRRKADSAMSSRTGAG
jgi:hypothetical protein